MLYIKITYYEIEITIPDEIKKEFIIELKMIIKDVIQNELKHINQSLSKPNDNQLLTRKEAARFLHCSLTTLYHYQIKNLIPYHQVGRKVLFKKNDLINSIMNKKQYITN